MGRVPFLPAFAVAVALAACSGPFEVSSPISEPGSALYDKRLIGTWYLIDGDVDEAEIIFGTLIAIPGRHGGIDVAGVSFLSGLRPQSIEGSDVAGLRVDFNGVSWVAHSSVIDGETYFSARVVDAASVYKRAYDLPKLRDRGRIVPHPEHGYWIIRAEVAEDGLLSLHYLADLMATRGGRAPRVVSCGEDCSFEVFDLSSEELVALIRAGKPGELFEGPVVFARIEGDYPPGFSPNGKGSLPIK